jgi:hypothetical protein
METKSAARKVLDQCPPLAPICEQYLDMATLGSKKVRSELIELFEEVYVSRDYSAHDGRPDVAARKMVEPLDDVTVNLVQTSFNAGLVSPNMLAKVASNFSDPAMIRNYVLLQIAIHGLEAKSGSMRQFMGLHDLTGEGPHFELVPLDLSTDAKYLGYSALSRYGVIVTNDLPMRAGERLFYVRRNDDLIIEPKMQELLWRYPDRADEIAAIVVARKAQDADLIATILSDGIAPPLGSGTL